MAGKYRWISTVALCVLLSSAGWEYLTAQNLPTGTAGQNNQATTTNVDPNKEPSELNHHIAGYALIGVGLLVIASLSSAKLRILQFTWPVLFILNGLFLAAWSDSEIWPRGNLSWRWLFQHDLEARQHKVFALILIALGIVEYLRASGRLGRFWRTAAFPMIALVGAGLLLFHSHGAGSEHDPNVWKPYLVNPALNHIGKPITADPPKASEPTQEIASNKGMGSMDMHDHAAMAMHGDHMEHMHQNSASQPDPPAGDHHHHHMDPVAMRVEREHFWFMVVGVGIALGKLVSDSSLWRRAFVPYLWPSGMVILGILLVMYRE